MFLSVSFSLACRCSEKAKSLDYAYFSIRFYGECWGGKDYTDFEKLLVGGWESSECINDLFTSCDSKVDTECAGKGNAAYVYKIGKEKEDTGACFKLL